MRYRVLCLPHDLRLVRRRPDAFIIELPKAVQLQVLPVQRGTFFNVFVIWRFPELFSLSIAHNIGDPKVLVSAPRSKKKKTFAPSVE